MRPAHVCTRPVCCRACASLVLGLTVCGLACSSMAALGVGLALLPVTPGRLSYYTLVAGAAQVRLTCLAILGCGLAVAAAWRPGRQRRSAVFALTLGLLAAGASAALSARVLWTARLHALRVPLGNGLFAPRAAAQPRPEVVEFAAGEGWQLYADLYRPDAARWGAQLLPAVVVVHGGAWRWGDKGENRPWNQWLVEHGYVVLDIQYRLAPGRELARSGSRYSAGAGLAPPSRRRAPRRLAAGCAPGPIGGWPPCPPGRLRC